MVKGNGKQEKENFGCWNLSLTLTGVPISTTASPQAVHFISSLEALPMPLPELKG